MENTATNVMKTVSLKDAFKAGIVTGVSPVRENDNEYLYVTFTDRSTPTRSTNIYFGKKSALTVEVDDVLTPEQMIGAEIILANNEEGDSRLKLSLAGASEYTDLASIFTDIIAEKGADHSAEVLKALKADMTTKEEDEADVEEEEDEDADAVAKAKAIRDAKAKAKADAKKK